MSGTRWIAVAAVADIAEGDILGVLADGHEIAVYHLPGAEFRATANVCTHGQAYLSEGWIVDDCQVECPLHAGCFDIRSGSAMGPPADQPLATYRVRVTDAVLEIELPT